MELNEFLNEYGEWIENYKEYDNGVIMLKFTNPERIMWLKGLVCEKLDMLVLTANTGKTYWFEPIGN